MHVFAYCAKSFVESVQKASGVMPITCPPMDSHTWTGDYSGLEKCDLLYLDLHGLPEAREWYGDDGKIALTMFQARLLPIRGAVVFAANCYLADKESPMLDALFEAGAQYVVAGDGQNFAGVKKLQGVGTLGLWFRRSMQIKIEPLRSLAIAKRAVQSELLWAKVRGRARKADAAEDTLKFRAFYRKYFADAIRW